MHRAEVSEADLLRALAALRDDEVDAAAEAIGFSRVARAADNDAGEVPTPRPKRVGGVSRAQPKDQRPAVAQDEAPWFWRVASDLPDGSRGTAVPAWLGNQPAIDDSNVEDVAANAQMPQPLASAHRFATFIRRHLAVAMRSAEPDHHVAVQRIARGEPLADCPALMRHCWPAGVHLLFDASPHLWPVAFDLAVLARELERLLGQRLHLYRCVGAPVALQDADMRRASLPADGAPLVVLSDAALSLPDLERQAVWAAWGQRQELAGRRVLLLAPVDSAAVTPQMAAAYDLVPLGLGGGLRLSAGHTSAVVPRRVAAADALDGPAALLRDCLYGNTYVEPALLRRLRRVLQAHGHEAGVGAELAVWRHPTVVSDPGGCTLHSSQRDGVGEKLVSLERALLLDVLSAHWEYLKSASPLVRAEFVLWWSALLARRGETGAWSDELATARGEVESLMRRIASALWTRKGDATAGLAAYLRRFGKRSPALLGASDAHQWAWVLAQREAIVGGAVQVPAAVDPAIVGRLIYSQAGGALLSLVQQGATSPSRGAGVQFRWAADASASASLLVVGVTVDRLWTAEFAPAARQRTLRWVRALGEILRRKSPGRGAKQDRDAVHRWLRSIDMVPAVRTSLAVSADARLLKVVSAREFVSRLSRATSDQAGKQLELFWDASTDSLSSELSQPAELERTAFELWAFLESRRQTGSPQSQGIDDLPQLLSTVLSPDDLEAVRDVAEVQAPTRQHLRREAPLSLGTALECTLSLPYRRLVLDAIQRPSWAEAVWHDNGQLLAESAGRRRLRWCPATAWTLVDPAQGTEYRLPHGCWWDEEEFRGFVRTPTATLLRPAWAERHGVDEYGYWAEFEINGIVQRMRFIPPGRFWMGSPLAEEGRFDNETLHAVNLTRAFWLADTACTQALWLTVAGGTPGSYTAHGANLPVVEINHHDVLGQFMPALERRLPGFDGRLPTEAEWEYAARAGTITAYPWGDTPSDGRMSFQNSELGHTAGLQPVRQYLANPWGLWQMHGNVWEWCEGSWDDYPSEEVLDPFTASQASSALRGGSWNRVGRYCRSAQRHGREPSYRGDLIGFRLAKGLAEEGRAEPVGRVVNEVPAESTGLSSPHVRTGSEAVRPAMKGIAGGRARPERSASQSRSATPTRPPGKTSRK